MVTSFGFFFPQSQEKSCEEEVSDTQKICLTSLFLTHRNWVIENRTFRNILYRDLWSQRSVTVVVQSLSPIQLFAAPWTAACQVFLSFTLSWSLLKLMAFLVTQMIKNPLAMQETTVQFLGREDPLERDRLPAPVTLGFPGGSDGKESTCNAGDLGLSPGLGRSPREGNGYPLQYSDLEHPMDYIVHRVAKSQTRLSNFHFHVHWLNDAIQPSHPLCPLLLFLLSSFFPSIKVFSNELVLCIRWLKYWSFSFSISLSNEYSGLISFKIDWISLPSKGLSRVFFSTTVWKHQFSESISAQISFDV